MALHRDIYWVGRQWAVTGYGLQAIDQKLKGQFDIEASRLWEEGLLQTLQAQKWFNIADFDKALAVARTRFPQPPGKAAPAAAAAGSRNEAVTANQPRPASPNPSLRPFAIGPQRCQARFLRILRARVDVRR